MIWAATACALAFATATTPVVTMIDRPVTAAVEIPQRLKRGDAAVLRMEGVILRRDTPARWNIFWEMPRANAQSSVDDLHFAGYVALAANSAQREVKPANLLIPLPEAAMETIRERSILRLTFVPIGKLPVGGVTIAALRLE